MNDVLELLLPTRLFRLGFGGAWQLAVATLVILLEVFSRFVFFVVPGPIMSFLDWERSKAFLPGVRLFRGVNDEPEDATMEMDTCQLIRFFGYPAEEHVVTTKDGFVLTLHRIPCGKGEPKNAAAGGEGGPPRPAVYFQHGLMQNSEAWVCLKESLAFQAADQGYDVWLGNNRGNKYSCRHLRLKAHQTAFWDFSLDEMAMYDVPACIDYILQLTGNNKLSYVGFSQGTAQGFACFSLQPMVADRVDLFVALSPAAKAKGLRVGMLKTFVQMAPSSVYLIFGTRAILSSTLFWRRTLTRTIYAWLIDASCRQLFDWHMRNMGPMERKKLLYAHLFSLSSVKCVTHWMQIAAGDRFQRYDENQSFRKGYQGIATQQYPISQIRCKVAMFYGTADFLTDMGWMIENVPRDTKLFEVAGYEHLDTIWGTDADKLVFPNVLALLKETTAATHRLQLKDKQQY